MLVKRLSLKWKIISYVLPPRNVWSWIIWYMNWLPENKLFQRHGRRSAQGSRNGWENRRILFPKTFSFSTMGWQSSQRNIHADSSKWTRSEKLCELCISVGSFSWISRESLTIEHDSGQPDEFSSANRSYFIAQRMSRSSIRKVLAMNMSWTYRTEILN